MNGSISFGKGFVYRKNIVYVSAVDDELEERDIHHAIMLRWSDGQWNHWTLENRIASHCVFDGPKGRTSLVMGIDGRVQIGDSSGFRWEVIQVGDEPPSSLRHLTAMTIIQDHVYVTGMARQVFRRPIADGTWERYDRGALVKRDSEEISGFKSIDGLNENDLYAVGFHGHIWHYDADVWRRLDSPTNVKLEFVKCITPEVVYIAGAQGTLLRGNKRRWEIIHHDATQQTIWAIAFFRDTVYFSTDEGVVYRVDGEDVKPVDMELDENLTTHWLHAADGILVSVGPRHVARFDGRTWTLLQTP